MDLSDQNLLSDFLRGREQAFRELSERHLSLVYGVAMRNLPDPSPRTPSTERLLAVS